MISADKIKEIVEKEIEGSEVFLVDVNVSKSNKIIVEIDKDNGINIQECADISRQIEQHLNRDEEDFELQVSSPGMGRPFKIPRQYQKNIGKKVEVLTTSGEKLKGVLQNFSDRGIEIDAEKKEKVKGKKKKQIILQNRQLNFDEIKETKKVITFK